MDGKEEMIVIFCAIYARYSSENQNERSIEDQIRILKEFAAARGWTVLLNHIYIDKAISGSNIAPRKGLNKLLEVAKRKDVPFQYILVYDTSRVARNPREALEVFEDLTYNNVYVYYVSQNIDTRNPDSKTMIALHGMTDSMLLEKISVRTHDGVEGQVLRGFSGGGSHYGYRSNPEYSWKTDKYGAPKADGYKIEIDAIEAEVVVRIFVLFGLKGWSAKRIVNLLNREFKETGNPKPPRGKHWCVSTILGSKKGFRGILNNELYIGKYTWNRTTYKKNPKTGKAKSIINPPEKWSVIDKPELRIVSDYLWAAVKKRQNEVKGKTKGVFNKAKHLYSGNPLTRIALCGSCGGTYGVVSGGKYPKYGCTRNHTGGSNACPNTTKIKKELLEEAVIAALCKEIIKKGPLSLVTEEIHCSLGNLVKDAVKGRQRAEIEKELEVVKEQLNNIGKFILSRPNTENTETVERLLMKNETRKKELENELLLYEVSDVESINVAELISLKDLEDYFLKVIDGLTNPATTLETLYSVVDSITVNCSEEVSIDVEVLENIKETVNYVLDLVGKRDARIQSISGTGSRLYTRRVFKFRILLARDNKCIAGASNVLIM
jgi:site-specific DNA recombinase